jgi:putative endonuclease
VNTARQKLGRKGEELARQLLQEKGYRVLESNYRCAAGEMDIIARDGDYVAFVEVRTRRGQEFGTPEESVTPAKKARLIRVAQSYLQERDLENMDWRIDLVAIEMDERGQMLRLEIIPNAVTG